MSTGIKDYYATLGVERDADADEIKRAFRQKARECHPDVCDDDDGEERFKAVNEAYEVLSDPRKREVYDRFGTADPRAAGMGADGVPFEDIFGMGMEDVFSMFFGGGARGGGSRRARRDGRDLAAQLVVSLEEVATGVEKELAIRRDAECEECGGQGGEADSVKTCPECGGSGQQTHVRQTVFGAMRSASPCDRCAQTGEIVENACPACGGLGRAPKRETVTVSVPAGARDGGVVRIAGMGEAGLRGAPTGDLQVTVRVAPHDRLFRDGDDLHAQVRIPLSTAVLGGTVRFQGLMYEENVDIPSGTSHGDVIRAKGRGLPRSRGRGAGDLYAHAALDVPKKLSRKERELLRELAELQSNGDEPVRVDPVVDWLGHR